MSSKQGQGDGSHTVPEVEANKEEGSKSGCNNCGQKVLKLAIVLMRVILFVSVTGVFVYGITRYLNCKVGAHWPLVFRFAHCA